MVKNSFRILENVLIFETTFMHVCINTLKNFKPCTCSSTNLSKDFEYKLKNIPLTKLDLVSFSLFLL